MNQSKKMKHLFEKIIDFENTESYKLPKEIYTCNKWSLPSFQNQKEELNRTKSLLNQFDLEEWSRHTKHRDPSSYIIRFVKQKFHPELVTQAWCKFYECLSTFPIIPKESINSGSLSSLHLCEAPGAFVSALNHYLVSHGLDLQWDWYANSLNPDHEGNSLQEMIPDDRLLRHTYKNWDFGVDFSGNVTKYYNHKHLVERFKGKVWLVTADGSVDCSFDPGNQESHVEFLHYCETLTTLLVLKTGGTLVLKIFTMFEDSTICLLYLLNILFQKVSTFKPASSKSGNSEVYVICMGYKGGSLLETILERLIEPYKSGHFDPTKSMFDFNQMDKDFLNQLLRMSGYFMRKQIERIGENVENFKNESQTESAKVHQIKIYVANRYISKYKLKSIPQGRKLVPALDVSQFLLNDVKKFKLVNNSLKIEVENLIPMSISCDILEVKLGEKINKVQSSRFCSDENLLKYEEILKNKVEPCHDFLYQSVEKVISENVTVINFNDCNFKSQCELQRYIFYRIFSSNKKHFLMVKVPFITNFLVGVMFILISSFKQVYLHKSGFILLYERKSDNVKSLFEIVDKTYSFADECQMFGCDIAQILSPGFFYNNNFFDFVWNYNSIVFSNK